MNKKIHYVVILLVKLEKIKEGSIKLIWSFALRALSFLFDFSLKNVFSIYLLLNLCKLNLRKKLSYQKTNCVVFKWKEKSKKNKQLSLLFCNFFLLMWSEIMFYFMVREFLPVSAVLDVFPFTLSIHLCILPFPQGWMKN